MKLFAILVALILFLVVVAKSPAQTCYTLPNGQRVCVQEQPATYMLSTTMFTTAEPPAAKMPIGSGPSVVMVEDAPMARGLHPGILKTFLDAVPRPKPADGAPALPPKPEPPKAESMVMRKPPPPKPKDDAQRATVQEMISISQCTEVRGFADSGFHLSCAHRPTRL